MSSDAALPLGACPLPLGDGDEVLLGHGSGGRLTAQLIEREIVPAFANPALARLDDAALIDCGDGDGARLAFTTDSYVITPIFFRGGDIGELAVNGTINDLAVSGARPIALSLAFILEEGLPLADLRRVIASARRAAARAGVPVVTGDTKVVNRGSADKLFINTSGLGLVPRDRRLGSAEVRAGDAVVVSGTLGDHGVAILAARHGLELDGELRSDTAPLHELAAIALLAAPELHAMRDPTRGGLGATLVEIATRQALGIELDERAVPIGDGVRGACELLGLDPLLVANEGKLAAFVPADEADALVAALRTHPLGRRAARVGRVTAARPGLVTVATAIGGERILELPFAEMLPRIC
jgi:hydrogenase expression/formation protein HypE